MTTRSILTANDLRIEELEDAASCYRATVRDHIRMARDSMLYKEGFYAVGADRSRAEHAQERLDEIRRHAGTARACAAEARALRG